VPSSELRLNALTPQPVMVVARIGPGGAGHFTLELTNQGAQPVLNVKLTLLDEHGARVLPVYYSDNFLTLLAGERRVLDVDCTTGEQRCARAAIRGWNVIAAETDVPGELDHTGPR
jgi:hypothetical protein